MVAALKGGPMVIVDYPFKPGRERRYPPRLRDSATGRSLEQAYV